MEIHYFENSLQFLRIQVVERILFFSEKLAGVFVRQDFAVYVRFASQMRNFCRRSLVRVLLSGLSGKGSGGGGRDEDGGGGRDKEEEEDEQDSRIRKRQLFF